jgi:hypothetical protein
MLVAAPVTPCRHHTGPTVLHQHSNGRAGASAAMLGGDVVGTHKVPVPLEAAVRTTKPAALRFGDPSTADRAGRAAATLIHQPHPDAGPFGLVPQGLQQVAAAPLPQPQVLHPTRILGFDAVEVPDQQGADLLADGERDHLLGGLMLGLVDAATMPCLHPP